MEAAEGMKVASAGGRAMPAILVVGAAVTEDVMNLLKSVDPMPQIQTYRFHWAVIHAIEKAGGSPVDLISTVPTRDYPASRKWFWGLRRVRDTEDRGRRFVIMPFVNVLGLKQVTRFISALCFGFPWLWRRRKLRQKVLLVYGVIVSHLYAGLIMGKLFGAKVVTIITDPPMRRGAHEGFVYSSARFLDRWLVGRAVRGMDGVIVLAEATSRLLAPKVPRIVVEGMISDDVERFCRSHEGTQGDNASDGKFVIMYAGQMDAGLYGVELLLQAFESLEGRGFALWLFGQGGLVGQVMEASRRDPRIVYWGFQDADVVFTHMRRASVIVNPRPVDESVTPFSFPSKVLESLAMGKIVVTGRLAGIPVEYHPYLVLVDGMNAANLAACLREVAGRSRADRVLLENRARDFAWGNKTQAHQGERICEFLKTVAAGTSQVPKSRTDEGC